MKRIFREPLLQFLVIGALVFAAYAIFQDRGSGEETDTIVVTPGRAAQLAETFSRTWQRPPTQDELDGLIAAYVKEEIFYREGRKLGLDTDDTVFRRRLQQKMEFLMEPRDAELIPTDRDLQAYLSANRETFHIPADLAFEQVFFDPARRGDDVEADARTALAALRGENGAAVLESFGDPTLLPPGMPLTPIDRIAISFGQQFADELEAAPAGQWTGPARSTFGLHLIRVGEKTPARDPELGEVLESVTREWEAERRRDIAAERYTQLRKRYEVIVETYAGDASIGAAGATAQ